MVVADVVVVVEVVVEVVEVDLVQALNNNDTTSTSARREMSNFGPWNPCLVIWNTF